MRNGVGGSDYRGVAVTIGALDVLVVVVAIIFSRSSPRDKWLDGSKASVVNLQWGVVSRDRALRRCRCLKTASLAGGDTEARGLLYNTPTFSVEARCCEYVLLRWFQGEPQILRSRSDV
jgi:hypothetical protein